MASDAHAGVSDWCHGILLQLKTQSSNLAYQILVVAKIKSSKTEGLGVLRPVVPAGIR